MKKMKYPLVAFLALAMACTDAPKSDEAEIGDAQEVTALEDISATYEVDTTASKVTWIGTKVTGRHNGTIDIKRGEIHVKDGEIAGGNFVFDIQSLQAIDQDEEGNRKLTGHLKSPDFFDAEKYPEAKFEITRVEKIENADTAGMAMQDTSDVGKNELSAADEMSIREATHRISGNLTFKDSTRNVTFPAKIDLSEDRLTAKANFNIDRTEWGISYGADKSLGDKIIYATVNIGINLVATNKQKGEVAVTTEENAGETVQ